MATKTLSLRINESDYSFLSSLAKEEKRDVSKEIRELVELGRVMLAINKYKKAEASLGKASKIAGVSTSRMMDILREYGVETTVEYEDYLKGLKNLRKVW